MNRVAKIIIYALVLFLLYLWINSIAKSCNNRGTIEPTTVESAEEDGYSSDEEIYDEFFESDEEDNETEQEVQEVEDDDEVFDEDFSFESKEKKPIAKSKTTAKQVERPTKKVTPPAQKPSGSNGGKYTIVAGSYLIRDNAEKMVTKLRNMGYSNAAVLNFDGSKYHTISAGQFSSYDDATLESSVLKSKGVDCYVHTRK